MDYLVIKLWPWLLAALATGLVTGWLSCNSSDDEGRRE